MTVTKDNGGPAFPSGHMDIGDGDCKAFADGMTLRDWFAGQALAGTVLGQRHPNGGSASYNTPKEIAEDAYRVADAMLEARK